MKSKNLAFFPKSCFVFKVTYLYIIISRCLNLTTGNKTESPWMNYSKTPVKLLQTTTATKTQISRKWTCSNAEKDQINCCKTCNCRDKIYGHNACPETNTYDNTSSVYECNYAHFIHVDDTKLKGDKYLMKSSCQHKVSILNTNLCYRIPMIKSDLYSFVPVLGSDGETFKNRYCAECNNVTQFTYWNAEVKCATGHMLTGKEINDLVNKILLSDGSCNIVFSPPDSSTARKCKLVEKCSEIEDEWKAEEVNGQSICKIYTSISQILDNIACFKCIVESVSHSWDKTPLFVSFSALLNFNAVVSVPLDRDKENNQCSDEEIYDIYTESCIPVACMELLVYNKTSCLNLYDMVQGITYELIIRAYIINESVPANCDSCRKNLAYKTSSEVYRHLKKHDLLQHLCLMKFYFDINHSFHQFDDLYINYLIVHLKFAITEKHDFQSNVKTILSSVPETYNIEYYQDANIILKTTLDTHQYATLKILDLNTLVNLRSNRLLLEIPNVYRQKEISVQCDAEDNIRLNRMSLCPYVNITKLNYSLIFHDEEVCFDNSQYFCLPLNKYFEEEKSILVCVDDIKTFMELYQNSSYTEISDTMVSMSEESILSFICTMLSLVCLFVSIITYCLFEKLRSLPGKNNMSMMISMMLSHALYQFGMPRTNLGIGCLILGLLTHFCWLLTFAWQTICCIHVFRSIAVGFGVLSSNLSHQLRTFVFYHFIAFVFAILFICINISVEMTSNGNIGYGGNICYISEPSMILFTFALPLGLSVLTNVVLIVIVVIRIQSVSDIQKHAKNEASNLQIYGKLSTLTGFTWIFGFLYEWTNVAVFSYLFVLFTASQGVFLMSAFILNTRVLNMYKSLFVKGKRRTSAERKTKTFSSVSSVTQDTV